jgi:hypothetical protein
MRTSRETEEPGGPRLSRPIPYFVERRTIPRRIALFLSISQKQIITSLLPREVGRRPGEGCGKRTRGVGEAIAPSHRAASTARAESDRLMTRASPVVSRSRFEQSEQLAVSPNERPWNSIERRRDHDWKGAKRMASIRELLSHVGQPQTRRANCPSTQTGLVADINPV